MKEYKPLYMQDIKITKPIMIILMLLIGLIVGLAVTYSPHSYILYAAAGLTIWAVIVLRKIKLMEIIILGLPVMFNISIGIKLNISIADFVLPVILFSIIVRGDYGAIRKIFLDYKGMVVYPFLLMLIVSVSLLQTFAYTEVDMPYGLSNILKLGVNFFYVLMFLYYFQVEGNLFKFLKYWSAASIFFSLISLAGVVLYYLGYDLGLSYAFRATGTFEDPNLAAAYCIISIGFCLIYNRMYKQKTIGLNVILLFIILVLTASRGAAVGFLVGCLGAALMFYSLKNMKNLLRLIFYVAAGALLFVSALKLGLFELDIVQNSLNRISSVESSDEGTQLRMLLWKTAFQMWAENPIFGVGTGQYINHTSNILGYTLDNIPHNTYLAFLAETGSAGFLILVSLPCYIVFKILSLSKSYKNLKAYLIFTMIAIGTQAFTINLENFRVLWVYLAFCVVFVKALERHSPLATARHNTSEKQSL
ncbi:O-antigen ligase family protein [Bacillus sp. 165]|uniref:O-antigen ligase family protein n=1 Tax=Bacillus sp. 165 TaxID=1529117 RepID=UPI001ADA3FD9|nr:O-antigen ligase family protein [Bacillus sp. 165]MBO9129999.1 O-antigen ligase family protein [Bacillus sp. 165]